MHADQAYACLSLNEIGDIATHRAHFEGPSQGTLAWTMAGNGFAMLRNIVEHAIPNQRATRRAAAIGQLRSTIAILRLQKQLALPKAPRLLKLSCRDI